MLKPIPAQTAVEAVKWLFDQIETPGHWIMHPSVQTELMLCVQIGGEQLVYKVGDHKINSIIGLPVVLNDKLFEGEISLQGTLNGAPIALNCIVPRFKQ